MSIWTNRGQNKGFLAPSKITLEFEFSRCFLEYPSGVIARWSPNIDSNLNLPPDGPDQADQRVVKVLSAPKTQNNLCGV